MTIVRFPIADCSGLISDFETAELYAPTADDIFEPSLYIGGKVVDKSGNQEGHKDFTWPDATKIDRSRIKPKLMMVKDQGLYLITNADLEGSSSSRGAIAYAEGCHPENDEEWWNNAQDAFGSGDGSVSFGYDWLQRAIALNKTHLEIKVTHESIELIL